MSAYRGAFIHKTNTRVPFIGDYVLTHESSSEEIQGGSSGEHYHLTNIEYLTVQNFVQNPPLQEQKLYEPLCLLSELMYSSDGQIMMAWTGEYV